MNISEIKKSLIEVSQLPWKIGTASPNGLQNVGTMRGVMVCQTFTIEDATLISNSPLWLASLVSKVEEMQKELEFYGNKANWELPSFGQGHSAVVSDRGERARQCLKGVTHE